jgi:DMSO/TMAO reductase YedYZ heme-binding membrane subunit
VLGLHNEITEAPLENRYFNILLTLGLPLFIYVVVALLYTSFQLLRRTSREEDGRLKLMLYLLFCVSYAHIGFAMHVPGLILLASVFVYVTERSGVQQHQGVPQRRAPQDSRALRRPSPGDPAEFEVIGSYAPR